MKQKILLGTDSPIMTFLAQIFDLILLNLLFILCSLPVLTIGSSLTALYSVTLKMAKNEEGYILRGFFQAFKTNFKQSLCFWIPLLLFSTFWYADYRILKLPVASGLQILRIPLVVLALIGLCIFLYSFPVIAYFKCTTKQVFQNILVLTLKHYLTTIFMLCVLVGLILLFALAPDKITLFAISIFTLIGFSAIAMLFSVLLRKIFSLYE